MPRKFDGRYKVTVTIEIEIDVEDETEQYAKNEAWSVIMDKSDSSNPPENTTFSFEKLPDE